MITYFLIGSGVLFWLLLLPIGVIVTTTLIRATKTLKAERRTLNTAITQHAAEGAIAIEQYLREEADQ